MEPIEGSIEEKEEGERVVEELLGGAEAKREKGIALCL